MTTISHSVSSRVRKYLSTRSFGFLLTLWLVSYFVVGWSFAALYQFLPACTFAPASSGTSKQWLDVLYFSCVTLSTVGYGDIAPVGLSRLLAIIESCIGIGLNTVLLGIVVFKVFHRSAPIVFPSLLVFEITKSCFWFRFLNIDEDRIRDFSLDIRFLRPLTPCGDRRRQTYDVISTTVELPFQSWPVVESFWLMALRTCPCNNETNNGEAKDFEKIRLSPSDFSNLTNPPQDFFAERIEILGRGSFESTGEIFFISKEYRRKEIVCGAYDDVNNYSLPNLEERLKRISQAFNKIEAVDKVTCSTCAYREYCGIRPSEPTDTANQSRHTELRRPTGSGIQDT